jgi:lysophospholipase L1-like esterase
VTNWKARLARLALALLIAGGIELAAGFWPAPRERLEAILEILELHPTRIWTLRKDLDTRFMGAPLHTDHEGWRTDPAAPSGGPFRIYVLGDSLTFGWGVGDSQTWPALLQRRLGIPVRNASVPGYTTWQGMRVLHEVALPDRPEVVMLCHGVNDVSKLRFFGSDTRPDEEQRPQGELAVTGWNLLMSTNTYRFLRNRAFRSRDGALEGQVAFLRLSQEAPPRVSLEAYARNLEQMVAQVRAAGTRPVLVKMPLNLPLPPQVSSASRRHAAELFAQAGRLVQQGDSAQALVHYREGLRLDPLDRKHCWETYELGRKSGDTAAAEFALSLLRRMEVYQSSARHVQSNLRVDQVARETGTPVVDVEALFARFPGRPLFNDPVLDPYHPNATGHALIAEEAARLLSPEYLGNSHKPR